MFGRKLIYVMATITMGTVIGMMIGCGSSPVNKSPSSQSTSPIKKFTSGKAIERVFSVDLPAGRVDVLSKAITAEGDGMIFQLDVFENEYDPTRRVLNVEINSTDTSLGYTAILTDKEGVLLWEFEDEIDIKDSTHFRLTERTLQDELTIEQWIKEESLTEVYIQNGERSKYVFPTTDKERISELHQRLLAPQVVSKVVPVMSEIDLAVVKQLQAFDRMYDQGSTLNGNQNGFLVAQILTDEDFAQWLYECPKCRLVCFFAAQCVVAKCPAGGLLNPVCVSCGTVAVICAIAIFVGAI